MPILCRDCQEDYKRQGSQRKPYGAPHGTSKPKPKSTSQALKLIAALRARGIKCEPEDWDGHKHVDIAINWADLYVEIDGSQHRYDAKQMLSDISRDEYSHDDGVHTLRFSNFDIDAHCDKVADAIATVARKRYRELR